MLNSFFLSWLIEWQIWKWHKYTMLGWDGYPSIIAIHLHWYGTANTTWKGVKCFFLLIDSKVFFYIRYHFPWLSGWISGIEVSRISGSFQICLHPPNLSKVLKLANTMWYWWEAYWSCILKLTESQYLYRPDDSNIHKNHIFR